MPIPSTLVKNKEFPLQPQFSYGLMNPTEQSYSSFAAGNFSLRPAAYFAICTGSLALPDISNTPGSTVLLPQAACPLNLRPYLTRCDIDVRGNTAWSGGNYVAIQDTNGAPLIYLPACALKGLSAYTFPDSDTEVPIVVTASSYVPSTGVVTLPSTALINGAYSNNCVATVIGGTGAGQSEIIASNTATTITPARGGSAWPAGLDSTSVIAIWYWSVTTGSASAPGIANQAGSATPLTANALAQGYNGIVVAGTAVGENRPIASNTTSAYTVTTNYNTATDTTSLVHFTNGSSLLGCLDLGAGDKWPAAAQNTGIEVTVASGMSAGSNLRIYLEGFFAP